MRRDGVMRLVLVMGMLFFVSCGGEQKLEPSPFPEVRGFYTTSHRLRKMFVDNSEITVKEPGRADLRGGFFLFMGGMSGEYKEGITTKYVTTHVRFAWDVKNNTYTITTLPLEKIKIKLVGEMETPTISFFLDESIYDKKVREYSNASGYGYDRNWWVREMAEILKNYYTPDTALSRYLAYAIIETRDEDWPLNINLPLNVNETIAVAR